MGLAWQGKGAQERGVDESGRCIVAVDPRYFRPTEVDSLIGDATKARTRLGWVPKTSFAGLVAEMAAEDLNLAEQEELLRRNGKAK